MRKLIDYMMTHPLFTGIAGIMVAIFSIKQYRRGFSE